MGDGERSGKTTRKGHGSRAGRCASGGFEILAAEKPDDLLKIEFVGLVKCIEPVAVDIEDKLRRTPRNERHDDFREIRKSTRLNSSHVKISYAVFCLKKKNINREDSRM